jgi:3',5'-cyclic AMP phosphodiesterase CpdA
MNLTLGILTDLHFGPAVTFDGKLRKLTDHAASLTRDFARKMREETRPDLVVNLGDVLEDESRDVDRARYTECMEILASAERERLHVAGNHDRVHLEDGELRALWELDDGPLYQSLDRGGVHLVTLATHERKDVDVTIDDAQLAWLEADLATTDLPAIVLMHHSASDQHLAGNRWFSRAPHLALVKQRKRLRAVLESSGNVILVVNGHLHWNHLDVIRGIPYVTVQSLVENLDDDAPGRAAAAHAIVRVNPRRLSIEIAGGEPCRYQFELGGDAAGTNGDGVSSMKVPPT